MLFAIEQDEEAQMTDELSMLARAVHSAGLQHQRLNTLWHRGFLASFSLNLPVFHNLKAATL